MLSVSKTTALPRGQGMVLPHQSVTALGAPAICFLSPRPQTHVGTPTRCGTILNVLRPTHSAAPSHTQKQLLLEEPGLKSKCSLSLPPRRPPVAAPPRCPRFLAQSLPLPQSRGHPKWNASHGSSPRPQPSCTRPHKRKFSQIPVTSKGQTLQGLPRRVNSV